MRGLARPSLRFAMRAVAVACALVCAWRAGAHSDDTPHDPTIKDLMSHPVEVHPDAPVDASAAKAMKNYREFLDLQNTDPRLRAEAMRRLADLNLESGQVERLASELAQIDLQGAEAIKLYNTLLKVYPDYPRNDQVLYQLARAYETTGQPDQALATLDQLVASYPRTPAMDEVEFRRGELLFSAKRYAEAQAAYARVVNDGRHSAFYQQSLYKQGWSLFKLSQGEESLTPFAGVLDLVLLGGDRTGTVKKFDSLSRANRELVDDTLRAMSITFSYLDGFATIDAFLKSEGDRPYAYLLYSSLGDLLVSKQRYQDAAAAYRAFVVRDPASDHAPNLAMQAIEAYSKGGFTDLVIQGKREYVERYNFEGAFWMGRKRADYPTVVTELKTNLKDLATFYHASAQSTKRIEDYQLAARWYRLYLVSFPDDPESAATDYLLAETLFESHDFASAATEYEHAAYDYPRSAQSSVAGYAALVAYQKAETGLAGAAKSALHARAIDSGVRFAQTFPEHPDSGGVLTRSAEDLFEAHNTARAAEVAQMILDHRPAVDAPKARIAWTIIGQAGFDRGDYAGAERAYIAARDIAADPKMRTDLTNRIAAAVYKQGEAKEKSGDANGAVEDFLRVAKVAPDSGIRSTAQYDAAAQLITLKQWNRAIGVLEDYRQQFPRDARSAEVTRKLAVAYAEANRPGQAAVEFERIAASSTETREVRREALQRTADLYGKANEPTAMVGALQRYVEAYPEPLADAMEARQRLADEAVRGHDEERALRWDREIIKADAAAGPERSDRSHFLAANAQLAIAAPTADAFRRIQLVRPLKRSLSAKKKALETALAAYRTALAYHVADVTTAATYQMAELYRTLGKDVLASERPKGLSKDELEQYETLLEDQAYPFEEEAIALHQENAARARDGLYDDWVKKSYAALAELNPGRYGKTELTQDVVTTLN